jgi:hypothetical protein
MMTRPNFGELGGVEQRLQRCIKELSFVDRRSN